MNNSAVNFFLLVLQRWLICWVILGVISGGSCRPAASKKPAAERPPAQQPSPADTAAKEQLEPPQPPSEKPSEEQLTEPAEPEPLQIEAAPQKPAEVASPQEASKPAEVPPAVETPKPAEAPKPAEEPSPTTKEAEKLPEDLSLELTVNWLPKPVDNPEAEAATEAEMKPYTETIPGTNVKFDMVPIPGGVFKLGSPENELGRKDDEGPQVEVEIEPFWMGKYEVTWNEYELWGLGLEKQRREAKKIAGVPSLWDCTADALAIPTKPYSDMTFGMGKEGYPAICMTQLAAKMYCKWLSAKTGRYYRLPTEAEWEYACRAGTTTAYSFGDDPEKLDQYAWFADNSDEKYHKVGKKKPNPWGLYDMHGNVCEWCLDEYLPERYKQLAAEGKPVVNSVNPVTKPYLQVVRGGAWTDDPPLLRSAARRFSTKEWKAQDPQIPQSIWYHTDADFVGFRVVRPLRTPTAEEAERYELTEFEKQEFLDYKQAQAGKQ